MVQRGGYHPIGQPHAATINDGIPVTIGREQRLQFAAFAQYRISERSGSPGHWGVQIVGYVFAFRNPSGAPLLAYHWHPDGGSRVTWPHLHISDPSLNPSSPLARAHLPTGTVALEDVIRLAITEFGVAPRPRHHDDWDVVLRETSASLTAQLPS